MVTTAIRGQDGRLVGFGHVVRDRHRAQAGEDALRASEEKFRSLVTSVADYAIFLLDADGTIVSWNVGAERLKGYTADEIIGRDLSTFYTEEDRRAEVPRRALGEARQRGRWEKRGVALAQGRKPVLGQRRDHSSAPFRRRALGYAKVTRDLTERKRNEDALRGVLEREREAAAQLREADQLRKEVVAVIAHDLRAPIQVVQNLIHLLQAHDASPGDARREDLVERVRVRLENMGALVDDIFELSRLEAGLLRTDLADIDLRAVAERVAVDTRTAFPTRTVTLEAAGLGRACADERRLGEVLTNLVSNAIKFSSDDAPVLLTIGDDDDLVVLCVRDYGTGVPLDQRTQIFQRFTRGHTPMASRAADSGCTSRRPSPRPWAGGCGWTRPSTSVPSSASRSRPRAHDERRHTTGSTLGPDRRRRRRSALRGRGALPSCRDGPPRRRPMARPRCEWPPRSIPTSSCSTW